ncbi:uncharacterized protein LOC125500566 [Athalia rosae]|uniref:uncharacterized protein LOC125500566 n=1 Tax=Athalia rosae TaxID=37344 RepID=UPI0020348F32|nr:uncharacterized protein LOC125500566 [Athalia rosae]XP_048509582.1 uncharacterized protein LOC125500566 [Athalia rosae]
MAVTALDLLKNPNFVLKIIELVLAIAGFVFVVIQKPFKWSNGVTIIFCVDTGTYIVILTVILIAYSLEETHQLIELLFTLFGVGVSVIGSILAFQNYEDVQIVDQKKSTFDFYLGVTLSANSFVMTVDSFLNVRKIKDVF